MVLLPSHCKGTLYGPGMVSPVFTVELIAVQYGSAKLSGTVSTLI